MSLEQNMEHHNRELVDKFVDPIVSYQMTPYDYVVRPSASAPITITLPHVADAKGRLYSIVARLASGVNTVTVQSKGDSESWPGNFSMNGTGTRLLLYSDGTTWHVIADQSDVSDLAGAVVAGKATATERFSGGLHRTKLTLTLTGANDLDLVDGADNGIGVKVYDFPAGRINIQSVVIDATVVVNGVFEASPNDVFKVGAGSVSATQAAEGDLTGTEVNLLPAVTEDTVGNTVLSLPWESALAAEAQFDGTAVALDFFINAAVLNASISAALTLAITGTVEIVWINAGDIS